MNQLCRITKTFHSHSCTARDVFLRLQNSAVITSAVLTLIVAWGCLGSPAVASGFLFDPLPNLVTPDSGRRNPVFLVGEPVAFTLHGDAAARYEVRDYHGVLVDQGNAVSPLTVRVSQPGWYKLALYGNVIQDPWGMSVGGTMFVIFRPNTGFPDLPPKGTYGGDPGQLADQVMRGVTGMGPRRLPVQDCNDPSGSIAALEPEVTAAQQYYMPYDPLRKRALFIAFPNGTQNQDGVRQIVDHFKDRITYWEGRNEPDSGSPTDFVAEEKAFSQTVKGVSPSLKVLGPGIVTIGPFGLSWMDKFFAAGGGQYIDALSFHAYNNLDGDLWLGRKSLDSLQALLAKYNLGTIEKWQTEQGYPAAAFGVYQPRLQGRWTMLQMMLYEQYGIPKEHNHLWYDVSGGFWDEPMFWENDDSGLNPAASLMRVWAEELYGTNYAGAYDFGVTGNGMYLGDLFTGTNKRVASFMSAGSPDGNVTLSVTGGASLHVVSAFGVAQDLPVTGGQVTLPVSEVPVYVEMAAGQDIQPVPVNWGPNLALQPGVTTVAEHTGLPDPTPAKLVSGSLDNFFWSGQTSDYPWIDNSGVFPAWVQVKLPSVQTVDHVVIYGCPPWQWQGTLLDYELQYDKAGQWVTIDHVQEPANTSPVFTPTTRTTVDSYFSDRYVFQHQFAPVQTDAVRLLVHDATYGVEPSLDAYQAVDQSRGWGAAKQINLRQLEVYNSTSVSSGLRIKCGGGAYTGPDMSVWQADTDFSGGDPWTFSGTNVEGTANPPLYPSVRYGNFNYVLPVAAGSYTLHLHFMEGDANVGVGSRRFNVSINGSTILSNFDVLAAAGARDRALVESFPVTAGSGGVSLAFQSLTANPAMVSAIELVPTSFQTIQIKCGDGGGYTSATAGVWQADADFLGGLTWAFPVTSVSGTTDPGLYSGVRYGNFGYALPAAAGSYTLRLHFMEGDSGVGAGGRVFNVSANGSPLLTNFDIGKDAGGQRITDVKSFPVTAGSGGVSLAFQSLTANPAMVSAIELVPTSFQALQIDAGGKGYVSATSGSWQADADYNGGDLYAFPTADVIGTTDPSLYRTVRYSPTAFSYTLPAAPGRYTLTLHFMEGDYASPGARLFNVGVNGTRVLSNFDVFAQAGGQNRVLTKTIPVTVPQSGSSVNVTFTAQAASAMVSAIELIPAPPAP